MAKRDVSRAFKWHFVRDDDVAEFGTSLPGTAVGLPTRVIMIHTCMVFGWSGSPGEYMSFSWGAKRCHERRRPPAAAQNDTVGWTSKWLMDDAVILEPAVGLRPWLSAGDLDTAIRRTWGADALNLDKLAEEGEFKTCQLVWGLYIDVAKQRVALPEQKCTKASHLLASAELGYGSRRIPLKLAQELRGSAQFWASAQPSIMPELPVIDRLHAGGGARGLAAPRGTPAEVAAAWANWTGRWGC